MNDEQRALLKRSAIHGALLVAAALLSAAIITPDLFRSRALLSEEHLGKRSPFTVRAEHSYMIEDEHSTLAKQKDAADKVLPVFEYYVYLAGRSIKRIHEAFKILYDAQIDWLIDYDIHSGSKSKLSAVKSPIDDSTLLYLVKNDKQKRMLFAEQREVLVQYLKKHSPKLFAQMVESLKSVRERFDQALGVVVPEEDFTALLKTGLPSYVESYIANAYSYLNRFATTTPQDDLILNSADSITVHKFLSDGRYVEEIWTKPYKNLLSIRDVSETLASFAKDYKPRLGAKEASISNRIIALMISPTFKYSSQKTAKRKQDAANSVSPVLIPVKKGEIIIRAGEKVTQRHLIILAGISKQEATKPVWLKFVSYTLFFLLLISVLHIYGIRNIRKYSLEERDYLFLFFEFMTVLVLMKFAVWLGVRVFESYPSVPPSVFYYLVPLAAGAMTTRLVLNAESAYLFAIGTAFTAGFAYDGSLMIAFYVLITSAVAADSAAPLVSYLTLLRAGAQTGLVAAVLAFLYALGFSPEILSLNTLMFVSAGFLGGMFSALLTGLMVPLWEGIFGYTTDLKLLSLINLNHPLLREMIVNAPGTHHHSMMVAQLSEAAAKRVHAKPLLCRAGAMFHDIGKIKKPLYFSENIQDGTDYHKNLTPSMSVRILVSHITEGIQIAQEAGLGDAIIDIIAQHHGTALITKFYEKARHLAEEEGKDPDSIDKNLFRYPGPLPATKEAGIVMLADAVELSFRNLSQPSAEKIRNLVVRIIEQISQSGQLANCELTVKDIETIESVFVDTLIKQAENMPVYLSQKKTTSTKLVKYDGSGK